MKVVFYYQTFTGLENIQTSKIDCINVSSVHFGKIDNKPYIHLNDNNVNDKCYDNLYTELLEAYNVGTEIRIMVGGAGLAYQELFSDFDIYYEMLKSFIKSKSFISGLDLDIEETVDIDNVKMLIRRLKEDFGASFSLSMAPVQSSLEYDSPGYGGFIYKDLLKTEEGKMIDYFNVQCYEDYSLESVDKMVKNGYCVEKLIIGSISSQDYENSIKEMMKIKDKYPNILGVYNWEYFDTKPSPNRWTYMMKNLLHSIS